MDHKDRYKRLRSLVHRVNSERKKQGKKIDILCNDLITAQRDFIKRLDIISFAATFYQSIIGMTDLNILLCTAGDLIRNAVPGVNVAFFLRQAGSFDLHIPQDEQPIACQKQELEDCFTRELMDEICELNRTCNLDDMFAMGLGGKLGILSKLSAVSLPLGESGPPLGFILIFRSSKKQLTSDEVRNISAITSGLSRAIASCQKLASSAG